MGTKKQYTVRLEPELLETVKEKADKQGISITELFEKALSAYVGNPKSEANTSTLLERVEALEAKFHQLKEDDEHQDISFTKPKKKLQNKKIDSSGIGELDPADLPELITIQQISQLTGYAVSSLRSKLSRVGVEAVDRIGGNRGGLYDKQEILDKVGFK